jgi:predicted ATPase
MPADAIDSITIRGFKSIASIESLRLAPINILIGANGSGKSNFIGVFAFLSAIRQGRLREYVLKSGGADKILHFGSKIIETIRICLSFQNNQINLDVGLAKSEDDGLYQEWGTDRFPQTLHGWRIYHLHDTADSSPMRKTARLDDNRGLRADGSNLPAFLYLLQEKHPESYSLIRRTVQSVAPFFDDFSLAPLNLAPDSIKLEWRHRNSEQYFDAANLSDGTLRFIALATLFLQPESFRPSIILVDEPELGLHPFAIEQLAAMIRYASRAAQVIVSTQSSLLIDHFEPEDILVANRIEGGTQIARLNSADLKDWLAEYSLGQLWEKNELSARPAPERNGTATRTR